MKAKTELLLYRMLWLCTKPMARGFRNVSESFEGWAYSKGLLAQLHRLEAGGFLESTLDPGSGKRLHRLTEAGRLAAVGPKDPEKAWAERWDGKWRLFLFDIPEIERSSRRTLTRALAAAGCGCLQGSVWISPTAGGDLERMVHESDEACSRLMILIAESKGVETDRRMVAEAWDFEAINKGYDDHMGLLHQFTEAGDGWSPGRLAGWTAAENRSWRLAVARDPLLPRELLPQGYLGGDAFNLRLAVLRAVAELAERFGASAAGDG